MRAVRVQSRLKELGDFLAVSSAARAVRRRNLTYLSWRSLRQLESAVDRAAAVSGVFVECGVALGGSAVVICSRLPNGRAFHGYDVFSVIPEPASPKDGAKARERYATIAGGTSRGIGRDVYYGYLPDLETRVGQLLTEFGVADRAQLHRGLFADTLRPEQPIAFAHLDCDWYDPLSTCLGRIYPMLQRGGYVVCDDYHNFDGAKIAVDEFLDGVDDMEIARDVMSRKAPDRSTSLVLRRR